MVRARPQAGAEAPLAEAVHFLQERAVGAAGEARRALVDDAERQELRRLELRCELRLGLAPAAPREAARHADHLEAAVLEVVGLLGVEGEDAVGERFLRGDEGGDLLHAEELGGRETVSAVRSPQATVLPAHYDDRIEE